MTYDRALPVVLTIAGSDSSGGAGIQADLRAIAAHGGYGASAITAVTAQNTRGVEDAVTLEPAFVARQIDVVMTDLPVAAVKSGMLANAAIIDAVAGRLRTHRPPVFVLDPVMISKSGFPLLAADSIAALRERLLPLATVVTPNVHEAQAIAGTAITTLEDAETTGRAILAMGPRAVVMKGGHLAGAPATDLLVTPDGITTYPGEMIESRNTHGTGCTFASALATQLARGRTLEEAVRIAKAYVTEAIRHGPPIGAGARPTNHFYFLEAFTDLPPAHEEHP